jgi:small multidrug resistance pump
MKMGYFYLAIAITGEVAATSALKATEDFTRLVPSIIVVTGYLVALLFLSLTVRTVPVGIAYAIWAGVGTALIVLTGAILFRETPDWPAVFGISLIVSGVVVVNSLSKMAVH